MVTIQPIQLYCVIDLGHLEVQLQFPFYSVVHINLMPIQQLNFFLWVHVDQSDQTTQILSIGSLEHQGLAFLVILLLRSPSSHSHLPSVEEHLILIVDFGSLRTVQILDHFHLLQKSKSILFLTVFVQTLFITLLRCH